MTRKPKPPKRKPASRSSKPPKIDWVLKDAEEALHVILHAIKPITTIENLHLEDACGRVVAREVRSPLTLPQSDRSERDGYAVRAQDCSAPGSRLLQVGEAYAGGKARLRLASGGCIRIATGADMPQGADSVVMFEDCIQLDEGVIEIKPAVKPGQWVAKTGSDVEKGIAIVAEGEVVAPPQIVALGSLGLKTVPVLKRPRALVFTTGDEVAQRGQKLMAGQVYDGNTSALVALLRQAGVEAHCRRTVRDNLPAMREALRESAAKFDLVVFTGGTSVGDHDYGRRALDAEGKTLVHGVKLKPGKPLLFGKVGKAAVFGLPGFPTSALVLAYKYVLPAAWRLSGFHDSVEPWTQMETGETFTADAKLPFMMPVTFDEEGRVVSTFKGSAAISSVGRASGFVELAPASAPIPKGGHLDVRLV